MTTNPTLDFPGWAPVSEAQRARLFQNEVDPGNRGLHNNAFVVRVNGYLDVSSLERALVKLVNRHPMLRVRFRHPDSRPEQSIAVAALPSVTHVELGAQDEKAVETHVLRDARVPLDASEGARIRAGV